VRHEQEATLPSVQRALLVVLLVTAAGALTGPASAAPIPWAKLPGLHTGPPPWSNDSASLARRLKLIGLHALGQEGAAVHIHAHLDLYVGGRHVTVPSLVGIDVRHQFITELHTHDPSGILHVESPTTRTFTLGQFFGEWGVRLTSRCVGRSCGAVRWWVDGKRRSGDPAALVLRAHQEIAVAIGPPPFEVPRSYAFPPGD
jgi:hypothetical protein